MVFDQYQRYETISRMISIIKRQEEKIGRAHV